MDNYPHQDNDYRAPDSAGERESGAPRRSKATKPKYVTLLEHRGTRRQIASQLGIRVEQLTKPGEDVTESQRQADSDLAELLEDLIDALRAV